MVDLKAIDARIRKLQKLKELLADETTRELIADPEIIELMKGAVSNGNGDKPPQFPGVSEDQEETMFPAEGSLKRRVVDAALSVPGKFNTRDIVERVTASGYEFGRDPAIAVNQALRTLARQHRFIRLVRAGSGRIPHIYEAVRRETKN